MYAGVQKPCIASDSFSLWLHRDDLRGVDLIMCDGIEEIFWMGWVSAWLFDCLTWSTGVTSAFCCGTCVKKLRGKSDNEELSHIYYFESIWHHELQQRVG
mmetsp:Transcript_13898/g.26170  ORF Transcript_13898/g.26170 Transcript_13898/m.26170 type:complete len:100 (+) Transcript_13898:2680-2979(+)